MRTRLLGTIAIGALVLAACGGDDAGEAQNEVADMIVAGFEEEGMPVDDDCVREVAGGLSDEDAQAIVEAGVEGDPELSAEAEAVGDEILTCVDTDALVDRIVADMGDAEGVDTDCLKRVLEEQGVEALQTGAMFECISVEGG